MCRVNPLPTTARPGLLGISALPGFNIHSGDKLPLNNDHGVSHKSADSRNALTHEEIPFIAGKVNHQTLFAGSHKTAG